MSLFTEPAKTIRRMFYRLQYQGLVEDHSPRDLKVLNKVIQEYELEKWIKFDPKDDSTWPHHEQVVLTNKGPARFFHSDLFGNVLSSFGVIDFVTGFKEWIPVTHWQPLPTLPNEVEV